MIISLVSSNFLTVLVNVVLLNTVAISLFNILSYYPLSFVL